MKTWLNAKIELLECLHIRQVRQLQPGLQVPLATCVGLRSQHFRQEVGISWSPPSRLGPATPPASLRLPTDPAIAMFPEAARGTSSPTSRRQASVRRERPDLYHWRCFPQMHQDVLLPPRTAQRDGRVKSLSRVEEFSTGTMGIFAAALTVPQRNELWEFAPPRDRAGNRPSHRTAQTREPASYRRHSIAPSGHCRRSRFEPANPRPARHPR